MTRVLIAVLIAGSLSGCAVGSLTSKTDRVKVDGVDCVKITTSEGGAGIDCNWEGQ